MKPMLDLKKQYLTIKDEIIESINEVLESTHYVLGKKGAALEEQLGAYHGMQEAIGVASGTDALHLAVRALGIGRGDEVITTPFTFFATAEAIMYVGATPVFVDVEPGTCNMDPRQIEAKITNKTKAILPVHIFGHPADMDEIVRIAGKHKLSVVEDCAQSFGASLHGKKTGSFGAAGCFSFYPSKNLGGYGDGGMLALNCADMAADIRKLRNHGSMGGYRHECLGYNSRLDEIQAAILLIKMKHIDEYNRKRREKAELYTKLLADVVACPVEKPGAYHVYNQYTIRSPKRDRIRQALKESGIPSVVYYPIPLHMQEAMQPYGYREGDFPVSERVAREVLSLPMYPELEASDIEEAAAVIRRCLE
ncbi:MAG TPA: DegT/DnrJ/EryC1/StrS family aminotransferase [Dissulfurispiraceae bacterium]|nr:DegT/DnrJ/EryC1/StrS family aminotransferase [Dissulfurispiraceae bacterium]